MNNHKLNKKTQKKYLTESQRSMLEIMRIAEQSSRRMDKAREKQLENAIENNNLFYLQNELCNVSTFDILKILVKKAKVKFSCL